MALVSATPIDVCSCNPLIDNGMLTSFYEFLVFANVFAISIILFISFVAFALYSYHHKLYSTMVGS